MKIRGKILQGSTSRIQSSETNGVEKKSRIQKSKNSRRDKDRFVTKYNKK